MAPLLPTLNFCSVLSASLALLFLYNRSFCQSQLLHLAVCLLLNPLVCSYIFHRSSSPWSRLAKSVCSVFLNLCLLLPAYALLISLSCVYIHTLHWQLVLCHSLILSTLTILPTQSISLLHLIFGINAKSTLSDYSPIDKFIHVNFLIIILASWFASFAYGLDRDIQLAHYPVASCLGGLIGSLTINCIYIFYHVFRNDITHVSH